MWTIIRYLVRFFQDLWHAAFFAAIEYDDKLKLSKTPTERFFIWLMVLGMIVIALIITGMLIRQALEAIHITGI